MKEIRCKTKDEIKVIQLDDLKEFLEEKYGCQYYLKRLVNIEYPEYTKAISVLSKRDNIKYIEFLGDDERNSEYTIHYENGNRETICPNEYDDCNLIMFKTLWENEDLVHYDSIKMLPIKLNNFFRTEIMRQVFFNIPDEGNELTNKREFENIRFIVNFVPEKIINLSNFKYSIKIKENDQLRYKLDTTKDLSCFDKSFYEDRKIKILDRDVFSANNYIMLKTYNNNLIILDREKKEM